MAYVAHAQLHEITAAKLAINAEVEQRQISSAALYLKPDADGPDVLDLERAPSGRQAFSYSTARGGSRQWLRPCRPPLLVKGRTMVDLNADAREQSGRSLSDPYQPFDLDETGRSKDQGEQR